MTTLADDEYYGDRTDDASYEDTSEDEYNWDEFDAATEAYLTANYPELAGDSSLTGQLGGALKKVGASAFDALKKTFTNKDGSIDWRSVAGAAGGLYGLYQANKPQEKVGYQGSIPKYEAVRARVPLTYDATRRAGSSGQQYFTAPQFIKQGDTEAIKTAGDAAAKQAANIANENFSNFARHPDIIATLRGENLTSSTPVTSPAGGGTAVASRPASSVAQDLKVPVYTEQNARGVQMASGGLAGMAKGRYLGGATDGMADKIPARIGGKQEARLSHGEFVIPADVVSHLGNGNSEAGAKRLYAMMDKIRTARTGTKKQGKQINPDKFLA